MAGLILNAMEAVANGTKYPEFKGNVAAVYTHPLENTPGSSGGHYVRCACTRHNATAHALCQLCLVTPLHWWRSRRAMTR